jgi:uncharacterized protein YcfJ
MNKSIAFATAAAVMITAIAPANAQMSGFNGSAIKSLNSEAAANSQIIHKTGRKGRRVAGAIALGLIGAAVIAGAARASEDREWAHERRCNKWRRWCRNGEDNACWKYENRC